MAVLSDKLAAFEEVWVTDTEYRGDDGNPHDVVCLAWSSGGSGMRLNGRPAAVASRSALKRSS
jgi:hypothetical protein